MKIRDIESGMSGIELVARVVSVNEPRIIMTKYGSAELAKAKIEDDTGQITLNLWRDQVDMVKEGDLIKIEGAFAKSFRGEVELNVGRRGKITVLKEDGP